VADLAHFAVADLAVAVAHVAVADLAVAVADLAHCQLEKNKFATCQTKDK
jgi:hypothetical protein